MTQALDSIVNRKYIIPQTLYTVNKFKTKMSLPMNDFMNKGIQLSRVYKIAT